MSSINHFTITKASNYLIDEHSQSSKTLSILQDNHDWIVNQPNSYPTIAKLRINSCVETSTYVSKSRKIELLSCFARNCQYMKTCQIHRLSQLCNTWQISYFRCPPNKLSHNLNLNNYQIRSKLQLSSYIISGTISFGQIPSFLRG